MESGTFYEVFCPRCGYFVQLKCNGENDKKVKEVAKQKLKEHCKKHKIN
jgi:hypothetical protein